MAQWINMNDNNPGYGTNSALIDSGRIAHTKYGDVHSQCLNETISIMQEYIKNLHGGKFIEIGVLGGASLLYNYDLCKHNQIEIYGIDPFEDITLWNGKTNQETPSHMVNYSKTQALKRRLLLEEIINKHNLDINIIKKTSTAAVELFDNNSISLLHIDGDHSFNGVSNDLNNYWQKIKSGGIIINDDFTWGCCKKAINEFIQTKNAEIFKSIDLSKYNKHVIIKK